MAGYLENEVAHLKRQVDRLERLLERLATKETGAGGTTVAAVTVTGTYTVLNSDGLVVCNSATDFTVTMCAALGTGRQVEIKNIGTGAVTVAGAGSDLIDGIASQVLNQWDAITVGDYVAAAWVIL